MISITITVLLITLTIVYALRGMGFFIGLFQLRRGRNRETFTVSVVIAARNEQETIGECLNALLHQSYPVEKYEIIIVDDRSTDQTSEVVESYVRRFTNVTLLHVHEPRGTWSHKKYALTVGIDGSNGDIIMTTDADCIVGPKWIEEMIEYLEEDTGMVVGFSQVGTPQHRGNLFGQWQATDFLALMCAAAGTIGRKNPLAASGQNLAYRKRAFQQVRGFERIKSRVSGDDVLLLQLIARETEWKIRFAIDRGTFVNTRPVRTLRAFFDQRLRWASNSGYQWRLNKRFFIYLFAIFAFNILLCITVPLSLVTGQFGATPLICFCVKTGVDAAVLIKGARLFGRKDLLILFPLWEILHMPLIIAAGLFGTIGRFTWKERSYSRQGLL